MSFKEDRKKHEDYLIQKYGEVIYPMFYTYFDPFPQSVCNLCEEEVDYYFDQYITEAYNEACWTYSTCNKDSCQEKLKDHLDFFTPSAEVLKERYSFVLRTPENYTKYNFEPIIMCEDSYYQPEAKFDDGFCVLEMIFEGKDILTIDLETLIKDYNDFGKVKET